MLEYASQPVGISRRSTGAKPWWMVVGLIFVWGMPFLVLSVVVGVLTGMIFWPVLGWVASPFGGFVVVYFLYRWVADARSGNGQRIVGYVEMAVRLNLPLTEFLLAAEQSEKGRAARQLRQLRGLLEAGWPVGAALLELEDVPERSAQRAAAGEAMGQLRPTLIKAVAQERIEAEEKAENPDEAVYRFYPFILLFVMSNMIMFIMIFVVPKFKDIFKDFKTVLPWTTECLMAVSTWIAEDWGWLILLPVLLLLLGATLFMMSYFSTRIFMPGVAVPNLRRVVHWFAWRMPLLHELEVSRGMAESCELLAGATREGVPLPVALAHAGKLPVNDKFRRRLRQFHEQMVAGSPASEAARQAHLPLLLVGLLEPGAAGSEGQSAMYAFLARYYRQRAGRMVLFLRSAWEPVMVLLFGSVVGFVVVSLFMPLVKLIASVSGTNDGGAL